MVLGFLQYTYADKTCPHLTIKTFKDNNISEIGFRKRKKIYYKDSLEKGLMCIVFIFIQQFPNSKVCPDSNIWIKEIFFNEKDESKVTS